MDEARYREAERRLWRSVGATPTEQRLQLARIGATVRVQEVGDGAPVVFVHGALNGGTSWGSLAARMPGFRCVLVDRPGCGLSGPLPRRTESAEDLRGLGDSLIVDVLDALGLQRAHVVGTSYGGFFALRAAAAHPDRIDRIVEFGWMLGASALPLQVRLAGVPPIGRLMAAMPVDARAVRAMLRRIGLRRAVDSGRMSRDEIDWYTALLRDTDTMRNELTGGPRFRLRGDDVHQLLPPELLTRIRAPIQFLWGEEDPFGKPDVARAFVPHVPGAALELVPEAGHAPWIDDPDRAAASAVAFLECADGRRGSAAR